MLRRCILPVLALLVATQACAENLGIKKPGEYLGALPAVPGKGCAITAGEMEQFRKQFLQVADELERDISYRRREAQKAQKANGKKMMEGAVDSPDFQGKSPEEMQKMPKAERRKMAEQMMQEKYGVGMADIKKLKDARDAEKKQAREQGIKPGELPGAGQAQVDFAKTLSGEMQVNDLMKSKAEVAANQQKLARNVELSREQQALTPQTLGLRSLMQTKVQEHISSKQAIALEARIKNEQKIFEEMMRSGSTCAKLDAQQKNIDQARSDYCTFMAPPLIKSLDEYNAQIQTALSRHQRLDEIASELQENQTGVGLPDITIGLSGLETVQDYTRYLRDVFKYNDRDPTRPRGSHCDGEEGSISGSGK